MAIPVKAANIILEAILKTFAKHDYEYVNPSFEDDRQISLDI